MKHYYEDLEGWWGELDASFYKKIVESSNNGSHFVEVGSFKGKSSSCMAEQIISSGKDIRLDCVDTWEGSEEHQKEGIAEDLSAELRKGDAQDQTEDETLES